MFRFPSLICLFTGIMIFMMPCFVLAAGPPGLGLGQVGAGADNTMTTTGLVTVNADTLANTIVKAVNWFAWFVSITAVAVSLYSGFLFLTSRGNPRQSEVAGRTLVFLVAGAAVAVFSFSAVAITKSILDAAAPPAAAPWATTITSTCPISTPFPSTSVTTGLEQCCDASGSTCVDPSCGYPYIYDAASGACILPSATGPTTGAIPFSVSITPTCPQPATCTAPSFKALASDGAGGFVYKCCITGAGSTACINLISSNCTIDCPTPDSITGECN